MNRFLAISMVVLAASAALAAQAPSQTDSFAAQMHSIPTLSPQYLVFPTTLPIADRCPVSMTARHGSGTELLRAGRSPETVNPDGFAPRPSQRIVLTLGAPAATKGIVSARLTAHGFSAHGRVTQAVSRAGNSADLRRTFNVSFTPGDNDTEISSFTLPGFTTVTSLQLDSITYADGTTWNADPVRPCHVAPSSLMLVAAQ